MDAEGYAMALVGAQWGSEGKGVIAAKLAREFRGAIRVGGPNAGHSLYYGGELFKMRSVPCLWVNSAAVLMIGAGAVVNAALLEDELEDIFNRASGSDRPMPTVVVDPRAVLVTHHHEAAEFQTIKVSIGSTAEGVGEARVDRVRRRGDAKLAGDYDWASPYIEIGHVASLAADLMEAGGRLMLEGTQGSGLSLLHGTEYPFVTSSDTNASGLASEAGLPPTKVKCTQLVARAYPIRVAGNSGPMGNELDWADLIKAGIVAEPEQTTVTKKTRRIAEWSWEIFEAAILYNDPCGVWLTFGDYLDPSVRGEIKPWVIENSEAIIRRVEEIEARYDVPVLGVSTGLGAYPNGWPDWRVAQLATKCAHGREYITSDLHEVAHNDGVMV